MTELRRADVLAEFAPRLLIDVRRGLENLLLHKLRTLLTMLGMIFGVAAVVSMLSIGAGAQQQVMALIEQLGVRNLIVEAREASDWQAMRRVRRQSPGLTFQDVRLVRTSVPGLSDVTPRKRFTPTRLMPKPQGDVPTVYGVSPAYQHIARLRFVQGRFFDEDEHARAAPVCVLGEAARAALFGARDAIGEYVKVNEQWFRVIGVAGPQLRLDADVAGVPAQDLNNLIYVPVQSAVLRLEDSYSSVKDEIDGMYVQLDSAAASATAASVLRGLLTTTHRGAADYSIVVPAELLAEQRRTQRVFEMVMVAIASISLLVGGIGIMNIMLASILERTREIGLRRAVGARRRDIVRQFLVETLIIALVGGVLGVAAGFAISRLIAYFAGWATIVTASSVILAFGVSVAIGLIFGIYPAAKAARLDPVAALHYE